MKTNFITAIYAIPRISNAPSAFSTIEKVSHQLGLLYCDLCDEAAAMAYTGTISTEHKQKLQNIAENDGYMLLFVEAEKDTKWIECESVHVPTTEEIKEHLEMEKHIE